MKETLMRLTYEEIQLVCCALSDSVSYKPKDQVAEKLVLLMKFSQYQFCMSDILGNLTKKDGEEK